MADEGSANYADVTLFEPPRTDGEWDTFLQRYAHDRIESHERPRPHHEDSNDSLLLPESSVAGSSSSQTETATSERTQAEERQRMRDAYETNGFLPGPEPVDSSLRKRRRMAFRLGLASPELESSKKAAIDEYTKLAQLMFRVDFAEVFLVTNEPALRRTGIDVTPGNLSFKLGICPHYGLGSGALPSNSTDGVRGPIVLPDLSKDWRFAKNPTVTDPNEPTVFYASVPLVVYRKNSPPIDIGTFCLSHPTPKHDFTAKDGEMLVRLAGLLVKQLVTLQGEMDSKHVGSLQTAAIDFIRRSVQPDVVRGQDNLRRACQDPSPVPSPIPTVRHKGSVDTLRLKSARTQRADSLEKHSPNPLIRSNTARASMHGDRPKFRTAPMSSRHLNRFQLDSEASLYMDACSTIRSMLSADVVTIVDLSEFHIYIRRSSAPKDSKDGRPSSRESTCKPSLQATKEQLSDDFFRHGTLWPAESEPLVQRVARHSTMQTSGSHDRGPRVLATTAGSDKDNYDFTTDEACELLSDLIKSYLTTRRAWWLRENTDDPIARRVSAFAPPHVKTTLILPSLDIGGRAHFAVFASWHQAYSPASETGGDLPFVRTLCGAVQASLAVKRMRALEQSQISYSNLQAHELRTPTHQLLAITALLRSAMQDLASAPISEETTVLTTTQQVRDLLPYLDAIDTSGRTLHEIIDNILSFLELRSRDNPFTKDPTVLSVPAAQHVSSPRSLEVLFEDLIQKVCEDHRQSRKLLGRTGGRVETVFEIVPPLLGESLEEDHGGALESALLKVLSNAYKFIDGDGYVQITVDDIPSLLPPAGYDDMAANKRVSIKIEDSGIGMNPSFLENRLFEPFAKEDPFTPGSGLSVHLAHRIIDVMGGQIAVSSSPGRGSTVYIEVPLPRREITVNEDEKDSAAVLLTGKAEEVADGRLVYLAGFEDTEGADYGRRRLGISLARQFRKVGSRITEDLAVAELVVADGSCEEMEVYLVELLKSAKTKEVVFLVDEPHDACANAEQIAAEHKTQVRRFRKPVTPAVIREILHPNHANAISSSPSYMNTPQSLSEMTSAVNSPDSVGPHDQSNSSSTADGAAPAATPRGRSGASTIEDAIASLSLGDYFSSRRRSIKRSAPSLVTQRLASPVSPLSSESAQTSPLPQTTPSVAQSLKSHQQAEVPDGPTDKPCIMVVEDNNINRAILCQMLRGLKADIIEAVDGVEAVESFRKLDKPVVVLLDINMPRMDGFSACTEFRAIEASEGRKKSWIVAVTALGSEAERQRGVVVGIDVWMQKPCGKPAIRKAVADGTARLQN